MYPTKSPGPDGMPPLFFQHYWELIGDEVTEAVQSFLHSGQLLRQITFTHICLITKLNDPEHMSDLRPIALCNVIYKICSKVIANRLELILLELISPYQSAFVPERLITDNILVANELAHFVHNKREGGDGYMALKLDLSKAYDRMEWTFLRKVMERFGFAYIWIEMLMQCVCSVRYSFLVRGKPRGLVTPSRGLRQGDPLSPYLFLIGAEGFLALLQQHQALGLLPGIEICREAPLVNHLLFVNDSMLYAQASLEDCYQIQDVIETYGRASGQLVNFDKSSVVFSKNVSDNMKEEVSSLLGVEVVESHEKYLGLPTYVGRKKTATFQYIKENWPRRFLIGKFWWGSMLDKRKIHWKTWKALCNPKEEGGLGFRSLAEFNSAMLAKQAWRVVNNPQSLIARLFKAKYFPDDSFCTASSHASPSYSWRSIFSTRDLLRQGKFWQIGDGAMVNIWTDSWIPGVPNFRPCGGNLAATDLNLVSDLIHHTGSWNVSLINRVFPVHEAEAILSIPLSSREVIDRVIWRFTKHGKFTVLQTNEILAKVCYNPHLVHFDLLEWLSSCAIELSLELLGLVVQERTVRWTAPPLGYFKVNVDGSFHQATKNGSIGFVIKDWQGTFLAGGGMSLSSLLSPEHVEALACKQALEFVVANQFLPAIVETDSQLIHSQLVSRGSYNLSFLGRIYDDLGAVLKNHANMRVTHTKRSANRVAHLMAAHATSCMVETFYFSSPIFLLAALAAEVCNL
ncbi:uncharacterized protein LOC133730268 [Rosa rugosa]|uniref:uncharacterized protein LOC133730268 n=1 Tax=Rosa rugosa TaxID=74645 RepID=UPI002B4130A0|nr:uncharacterized protein LOC133730268 [Rosa rugosa]